MNLRVATLLAVFLLAGCVLDPPGTRKAVALAEAQPVGEPLACLVLVSIDHTRVRNMRTIDFHLKDGKVYRSNLPAKCPRLAVEHRFVYGGSFGQVCAFHKITLMSRSGGLGPSCALGKFQRLETAALGEAAS